MIESPLFSLNVEPGQPGVYRAVATCVACKESSGPVFTRELRDSTGEVTLTLDPLPVFRTLGWTLNTAGGAVCSAQCAGIARHKAADFTVDASGNPLDVRINHTGVDPRTGARKRLRSDPLRNEKSYKCSCAACPGGPTEETVRQTRATVDAEFADPLEYLEKLGWARSGGRLYCSKQCVAGTSAHANLPPLQPVVTNPDRSAPKPYGHARREERAPNAMLVAHETPLPNEPSPRGRRH
jgi:hypothetical protein